MVDVITPFCEKHSIYLTKILSGLFKVFLKVALSKAVVAAIDFGTTFSGYAFSIDFEADLLKIQTSNQFGGGHIL